MSFDLDMSIIMQKGYNTLASILPGLYPFFGIAIALFLVGGVFFLIKKFGWN